MCRRTRLTLLSALAGLSMVAIGPTMAPMSARAQGPARAQATTPADGFQRQMLDRYCVGCHNDRMKSGGLVLAGIDLSHIPSQAETWEKVVRKLNAGMMPLPGQPRPAADVQQRFVTWVEGELDAASAAAPNPGRTATFHRLNRTEYQNVVRDLLAVDLDVAGLLPPDDAGYGFDNIAGVLRLSQSLMERYLSAARKISRVAVGGVPPNAVAETFGVSSDLQQYDRAEGLPFGTRGGTHVQFNFPRDGVYVLRATFSCALVAVGGCDPSAGFDDVNQLEFAVDGQRVGLMDMSPRPKNIGLAAPDSKQGEASQDLRWQVRIPVKAGVRDVAVAFLKLPSYETSDYPRLRFIHPSYEGNMVPNGLGIYQPHLASVTIAGPFEAVGGPGDTPSRRQVFVCAPTRSEAEAVCARRILSTLARRAYRRPVKDADVEKLFRFYADERKEAGSTFESGIEMALRALLVSSEFLFRIEVDPSQRASVAPAAGRVAIARGHAPAVYRISDLELASRLSFFLWSSIPDDTLLDLAARGRLKEPAVLEREVRRMLADPRADALSTNFLPQWLNLRPLQFAGPADPDFDESLRASMLQETERFFDSILRENRPVTDLLTADYTFLNERLATHYGIPNVKGSHLRRVTLSEDSPRRGLLGHASILTTTSFAIRTSPVKRGKWILGSILGVEPPPPPPNVPVLEEKQGGAGSEKPLSMRERMASHRANPTCAGCHSMIDPVGFAMENFDPTGRWRDVDATMAPIDASGQLPDGQKFSNMKEFRTILNTQSALFAGTVTEKLMTYAVGRGLEFYDRPAIRAIVRRTAADHHRLQSLILEVVRSAPFQMRTTLAPDATTVAGLQPQREGASR